jgi:glycosyltransferase involved in cell wall biosynthesis
MATALKLLLIYYEPRVSGQTTHVLSLARFLDKNRYQLTVVLPAHLAQCQQDFLKTGAHVVLLPMRKFFWPLSSIITFFRLVNQAKMELVHIHSQEMGLTARPLAWLAGARAIFYTPQTIDIRQTRWSGLYIFLERTLARITKAVISVNERDRSRLVHWGIPARKVAMVPNGIDPAAVNLKPDRQALFSAMGIDDRQPLVMQVGRLSAQKNPHDFIEGAILVLRQVPQVQFALIGEGPLEQEVLEQVRSLGLENSVHLLGWQPEASCLMAAANVVTLTSLWEGMPYSLLEAMAQCKPVVATSVNGCAEIVEDGVTGYLVAPQDPTAWAERVISLLRNPVLADKLGQAGRQRLQEKFSVHRMIHQLDGLYS